MTTGNSENSWIKQVKTSQKISSVLVWLCFCVSLRPVSWLDEYWWEQGELFSSKHMV